MSDYLLQIENEYSRIRGRASRLNPLDWQMASEWEDRGVPMFLVLRAMGEVEKKFKANKRPDSINSLSYFKQEVERQFGEYSAGQVGKSLTPDIAICKVEIDPDDNAQILLNLSCQFEVQAALIESKNLALAVREVALDLRDLAGECEGKLLSDLEDRLAEMAYSLLTPLATSLTEDERTAMIAGIDRELGDRRVDDDTRARLATKKLYEKYGLPELTLFEF